MITPERHLFGLLRRKTEKIEFIPVSDEFQKRLNELMVCDLCPQGQFHPWHIRWSKKTKRWMEWEDGDQILYFTVFKKHQFEVWQWQFSPDKKSLALKLLLLAALPSENQPEQPVLTITPKRPVNKYWRGLFRKEGQKIALSRLLEGFT